MVKKTTKTAAKKKPARAKKGAAQAETTEAATAAAPAVKSVYKMPQASDIENLLRRCKSLAKQASETNGTMGEMIQKAVEGKNLDRKAFSMVRAIERMSPEKMATTLAHFDHYRKVLKLDEEVEANPGLGLERTELGEGQDEPQQDPPRTTSLTNPKSMPSGETVKAIADRAGAKTSEAERDLRPAHLRTVAEGGTRVDEEHLGSVGRGGRTASH